MIDEAGLIKGIINKKPNKIKINSINDKNEINFRKKIDNRFNEINHNRFIEITIIFSKILINLILKILIKM